MPTPEANDHPQNAITLSHNSTVRVQSRMGGSSGSGFMIGQGWVLTCFHVVAAMEQQGQTTRWQVFPDLQVMLPDGSWVPAHVVSMPSQTDGTPIQYDFAFLKLHLQSAGSMQSVELAANDAATVGDVVVFSGYPLTAPEMITHRGMISGFAHQKELIAVQASINKGNSGGGLLNHGGQVIGIISTREGRISQALDQIRQQNNAVAASGLSIIVGGMDPHASTNAIIDTLDMYISTGIGYARSIRYARAYQRNNSQLFR